MTTLPTPRYAGDYTSPAALYAARYFDGEGLTVRAARIFTGNHDQPEAPGVAIETRQGRLVACLLIEHADHLATMLAEFIGGQDKEN